MNETEEEQFQSLLDESVATVERLSAEKAVLVRRNAELEKIISRDKDVIFAVSNDGGKTGVAWRENVHDALEYLDLQNVNGGDYAVVAVRRAPNDQGSKTLEVGEVVRATKQIMRKDNRCLLHKGETATVTSVWNGTRPGVQIVSVRLEDGNQMIDIVVENGIPLVRAESQNIKNEG